MDGPIRVLHVVVNMNRGGAETLIMNLYRNINRNKVQFDFLTFKPGAFDAEIINMGGRVHRIPYITDVGHIRFARNVRYFLQKKSEYKIVHAHMDKMSGIILRSAKKANVPTRIAHSHNTESEGGFFAKAYKWYAGTQIVSNATHLYACSNKAAKWLFKNKAKKAHILKNGIETDQFTFSTQAREMIRNELEIGKNTLVIGHVGRFSHQKNHLTLLEIFSTLHKKTPNVLLVLVGDGLLRKEIEKKIKQLNLEEKVKILGIRPDTSQLLQAFDLFMMPSLHEGLPVTLIEAQGAGLPCLISNKITREVDLGLGLVEYLPLTNKNEWIKTTMVFLREEQQSRKVSLHALSKKGYNIRNTAMRTEEAYLVLGEKAI